MNENYELEKTSRLQVEIEAREVCNMASQYIMYNVKTQTKCVFTRLVATL